MKRNPLRLLQYNSPVILTFALFSMIVLWLGNMTDGRSNELLFMVYRTSFTDPLAYIRVFTHAVGHANLDHFLNNFLMILLVGPMLEEKYGSKALMLMITITAFVTGVVHLMTSQAAMLGASGIVFMLILLSSFTNIQKGRIPLTLILALAMFIGREIMASVTTDTNIAHLAHIIGGVCGASFGFLLNKSFYEGEPHDSRV